MFGFGKQQYSIVEVERNSVFPSGIESQGKPALASLAHHPGFRYLLSKLRLQKSLLEGKLKSERHQSLKDVEFLQSGIMWTAWLQGQLDNAVGVENNSSPPRITMAEELEAFQEIQSQFELVG